MVQMEGNTRDRHKLGGSGNWLLHGRTEKDEKAKVMDTINQ
jgi:hypothetical protein